MSGPQAAAGGRAGLLPRGREIHGAGRSTGPGHPRGRGRSGKRTRAAGKVTAAAAQVMDGGRAKRGTEQLKACRSGPETQLRPGCWPRGGELAGFQVGRKAG